MVAQGSSSSGRAANAPSPVAPHYHAGDDALVDIAELFQGLSMDDVLCDGQEIESLPFATQYEVRRAMPGATSIRPELYDRLSAIPPAEVWWRENLCS